MRLERAVRFGFIGAVGVTIVSLVTSWLLQQALTQSMSGFNQLFVSVIVGGFGTAVALSLLFGLIDALVDEKLDERGQRRPGESATTGEADAPADT